MTPTIFFTAASIVLAGLILVALRLLLARTPANLCLAGFVAFVIPSPLMLVVHSGAGIAMAAVGVACLVPALILAEDVDDDEPGGGRRGPDPVDPEPDPGFDPDLWDEFERGFRAHVDRRHELVHA